MMPGEPSHTWWCVGGFGAKSTQKVARAVRHGLPSREQVAQAILGYPDHHYDSERDQHEGASCVQGVPEPYQHREEQPGSEQREEEFRLGASDRGDHHQEKQQAYTRRLEPVSGAIFWPQNPPRSVMAPVLDRN